MRNRKGYSILMLLLTVLLFRSMIAAEEQTGDEGNENCLKGDTFSRYIFADPVEIMPNIDEKTTVHFNYQCDHNTDIQVLDEGEALMDTIITGQLFSSGANQFEWNGKLNGEYAENGFYNVKVVPNDDNREYAFSTQVQVYNFKYPSLLDMYGEPFKASLREHRRGE